MTMKKASVGLATLILLLTGTAPPSAYADTTVELDMRFAGAFATGILHVDPLTGITVTSPLIGVQFKSNLGSGVGQGSGAQGDLIDFPGDCLGITAPFPNGLLRVTVTQDPLVFTFKDLSLLFADGEGVICVDFSTSLSVFEFQIDFIDGRGRFEGATGSAVIEGEAQPVSRDTSFSGETGTIKGWVTVPHDLDDDSDGDSDSDSD